MNAEPLVSIGLPVYNGESFLAETLAALVGQTHRNTEIIISDNASTDGTEEIARSFASADPRVRYERLSSNIGPAHNFNRLVDVARGKYFKWAAHDDLHAPDYLERCVARLEEQPSAVLCQSRVRIIDEVGALLRDMPPLGDTASPVASTRFRSLIFDFNCHQVFGVIRLETLKRTGLIRTYPHGDGVLLAELALHGEFADELGYLFWYREHPEQSITIARTEYRAYAAWFNPATKGRISLPYWRRVWGYLGVALWSPAPIRERLRSVLALIPLMRDLRRPLLGDLLHAGNVLVGRRAA